MMYGSFAKKLFIFSFLSLLPLRDFDAIHLLLYSALVLDSLVLWCTYVCLEAVWIPWQMEPRAL